MSWARYPKRSAFVAALEQSSGVKVGVRMRPFTNEEKKRKSERVVEMDENGRVKLDLASSAVMGKWEFFFDHSFSSFNEGGKFGKQEDVYAQLGSFVTDALNGFNCSLLAYGQSGSGKSYSMIGIPNKLGIIYRGLQDFFKQKENTVKDEEIELELSFTEIYNDQIIDLLNIHSTNKLRVRADRKTGMYIQGLTIHAVSSYEQALIVIDSALRNRILANRICSSLCRSHFMCTMYLRKITSNDFGTRLVTDATVNLIDLAGCESRVERSSKALRNVIMALSQSERFVPYRSSVLTNLLRECFDGNSKTTLICTVSPSLENSLLTLSTLQYASRVNGIVSTFWKNEPKDPVILMALLKDNIRTLNVQIQLSSGKREKDYLRSELEHYYAERQRREKSHAQRSAEQISEMWIFNNKLQNWGLQGSVSEKINTSVPRLSNISQDPIMSGKLVYYLTKFNIVILVGSHKIESSKCHHLVIQSGVETKEYYAKIWITEDIVQLTPNHHRGSLVYVNGVRVKSTVNIFHDDRIIFGNFQLCFHFSSPYHVSSSYNKQQGTEPMNFDEIASELQHSDFELMSFQPSTITDRKNRLDRKRLVQINQTAVQHKLHLLEKAESRLLRQYHSNLLKLKLKFREKPQLMTALTLIYVKKNKIDKEIKTLLRDEQKVKKKLQQKMARNNHMFDYCKQLDELVDSRLKEALTMCRWSTSMAQLSNINTVYGAFTVPYWNSTLGLPSDKVMIVEKNIEESLTRSALYEFRSFEMRYAVQAGFREIDPKINPANPFIPAMPTRFIGTVQVTDTKKSIVPKEFPILAFGRTDEVCGKFHAWLDVDRSKYDCEIILSVQHIHLEDSKHNNEIKILSFVNPFGGFEVIEGTMADDGKSYCYSESRIMVEGSEGLDTYLSDYGFRIFVSVFTYHSAYSMPVPIFRQLMLTQIELQHCKELLYIQERKLGVFKNTLEESEVDLETLIRNNREIRENLQFKNFQLRGADWPSPFMCDVCPEPPENAELDEPSWRRRIKKTLMTERRLRT